MSTRYTFTCERFDEPDRNGVEAGLESIEYTMHEAQDDTWPELIEKFKFFLQGCGFFINDDDF